MKTVIMLAVYAIFFIFGEFIAGGFTERNIAIAIGVVVGVLMTRATDYLSKETERMK